MITEIMYNPPESGTDSLEFIEITNVSSKTISLANCSLTGVSYSFPSIYSIQSGKRIVIAKNAKAFKSVFGYNPIEWISGELNNLGKGIAIKYKNTTIDTVYYNGSYHSKADGKGASITFCNLTSDNNMMSNWGISYKKWSTSINGYNIYADPYNPCVPEFKILDFRSNGNNKIILTFSQPIAFLQNLMSCFSSQLGFTNIQINGANKDSITINYTNSAIIANTYPLIISNLKDTFGSELSTTLPFVYNPTRGKLSISEIMYNPNGIEKNEYLEFYNYSTDTILLNGLKLKGVLNTPFPNTSILPGRYFVLCNDSLYFKNIYQVSAYSWMDKQLLPNNTGHLAILNSEGDIIDSLTYQNKSPWTSVTGKSIEICDAVWDNSVGINWKSSNNIAGKDSSGKWVYGTPFSSCTNAILPAKNLGVDRAVCNKTILDAGNQFTFYKWSTKETSKTINVQDTGLYWVLTVNGVGYKYDTIRLFELKPLACLGNQCNSQGYLSSYTPLKDVSYGRQKTTWEFDYNANPVVLQSSDTGFIFSIPSKYPILLTTQNGDCKAQTTVWLEILNQTSINSPSKPLNPKTRNKLNTYDLLGRETVTNPLDIIMLKK